MKTHILPKLPISALAGIAFASSASGAILVYEGFQYSDVGDPLDAVTTVDTDAIGLSGSWSDAGDDDGNEMFLKSGSLSFSDISTNGNHIGFSSNSDSDIMVRDMSSTGFSGSIYFSFLFQKLQNNFGADHEGFAVMNGDLPAARWDNNNGGAVGRHGFAVAAVNNSNLNAILYDGTTGSRIVSTSTIPITVGSSGNINLIVGEISFNTGTGGADVFKLYNATDDGSLDAGDLTLIDTIEADMDESLLTTLNLTRQVNINYDEVRIATTLDEALGLGVVPEPSTTALLGLGGLALILRRRK